MKTNIALSVLLTVLALSLAPVNGQAHEDDHVHEKKVAGPNKGRVIKGIEPHAEFLVTADRKIEIRFLDDSGKVIAPTEQSVTAVAGNRTSPTSLTFQREGDVFTSVQTLPAGNNFPTIVRMVMKPGARPVYERFQLNLETCGECKLAEYACICDEHTH